MGEWSPRVRVEAATPHGISQAGLALKAGGPTRGRVVLREPRRQGDVSLVWGPNPATARRLPSGTLGRTFAKVPSDVHCQGRYQPTAASKSSAPAAGSFHVGAVSLMPADNVSGFKAATIRYLKELGIGIARWPGGNFVSAYDWRDGIGDRDRRPPRRELAWNGMESNDMGIDDFMTFCRLIGAEPYLAVNSGPRRRALGRRGGRVRERPRHEPARAGCARRTGTRRRTA